MQVKIDTTKKTATIIVQLYDTPRLSSTQSTEAIFLANNQETGATWVDGRPIKMSLNLYVKPPKAAVAK